MSDGAVNLLADTLSVMKYAGVGPDDVRWVGSSDGLLAIEWLAFGPMADFEYDSGFGGRNIAADLVVVGDDWWLERGEYDGSEWWEFKRTPVRQPDARSFLRVTEPETGAVGWHDQLAEWNPESGVSSAGSDRPDRGDDRVNKDDSVVDNPAWTLTSTPKGAVREGARSLPGGKLPDYTIRAEFQDLDRASEAAKAEREAFLRHLERLYTDAAASLHESLELNDDLVVEPGVSSGE